jgi:hypothetical protein
MTEQAYATVTEPTITIHWCPTYITTPYNGRVKLGHEPYCVHCYKSGSALPVRGKSWKISTEQRASIHQNIKCAACGFAF